MASMYKKDILGFEDELNHFGVPVKVTQKRFSGPLLWDVEMEGSYYKLGYRLTSFQAYNLLRGMISVDRFRRNENAS